MNPKEKWSEAKTTKFIHSYLQKPSLWNINDSSYNKKQEVFNKKKSKIKSKLKFKSYL